MQAKIMALHKLPFGNIDIIREDIAEVVIYDGIELDEEMVEQYHSFLLQHLQAPFSLLINRINGYSYTFNALLKLDTLVEINALAVVTYSQDSKATEQLLASYPRHVEWNMSIFSNRDLALNWLISEQSKT